MHISLRTTLIFVVLSCNVFAMSYPKGADKSSQLFPIIPMLLGSALVTWGAYELGDTVAEGQRNVMLLWGTTAVVSTGLILYQSSKNETVELTIKPHQKNLPSIALNYRF